MASNDTESCCIHGCRNKQGDGEMSMFKIPKNVERRATWLRAIDRDDLLGDDKTSYLICAKHYGRTVISGLIFQKLLPKALQSSDFPTNLILNRKRVGKSDVRISEVETTTDITHEKDVFVEILGRTVLIKKEKDPEKQEFSNFVLDRPIKRELGVDIEESDTKKRKL